MSNKESKPQKEQSSYLENLGYEVFITVTCNRNGITDIVACGPEGEYVGVETKVGYNGLSSLQAKHINNVRARGGRAGCCRTLEDLKVLLQQPTPLPPVKVKVAKVSL